MTYKERLSPWCVIRQLSQSQRFVVSRFRRRNDAEEHLRVLQQKTPDAEFSVIFDPMLNSAEATAKSKLRSDEEVRG